MKTITQKIKQFFIKRYLKNNAVDLQYYHKDDHLIINDLQNILWYFFCGSTDYHSKIEIKLSDGYYIIFKGYDGSIEDDVVYSITYCHNWFKNKKNYWRQDKFSYLIIWKYKIIKYEQEEWQKIYSSIKETNEK